MVLLFCAEFRELSHLTCDLSQAEKKINVVTSKANTQNDIKMVEVVILGVNSCHFVSYFLRVSRVKWDNYQNSKQKMKT